MDATGLLLAGGKSSRMGTNKAMLPMSEGINIQNIASELKKAVGKVLLVTNAPPDYAFLGMPTVQDEFKELGPLAGLHAGLSASKTEVVFVSACDMPFIKAAVMKEMLENLEDFEALVPEINGQLQPLFAVYRRSCLPLLASCLENRKLRMIHFLEQVNVKVMKETDFQVYTKQNKLFPYLFFNMNTPLDYENAKIIEKEFAVLLKKDGEYS
ncbi:molybdenum cofactor guanylyltransferase [Peribacillus cavernae]|uniref:Probable molybdenum cofactor guanylyltransferase n=1 Tax=Peribacillus cavernae TaxID=1674310 RepID=A0A3S0W309_9BACI|nr:molybdenum cofactor guanylyltransferase [Peribacillus cavernae]MDQ0218569.1 molybdopterin-guanine dinucleotide biosynthesis protein A [Peribacillus cavernae]RUQ31558.1 molybdenum cofactor guanylyltransferase [Peribacillus cavernae]